MAKEEEASSSITPIPTIPERPKTNDLAPISDVLICIIKDARYHSFLVRLLLDVTESFSPLVVLDENNQSNRLLPELELTAHILLYIFVYGNLQRRRPSTLGMEFANLEVDTSSNSSWYTLYSLLNCLLPYFLRRAGRGWGELAQLTRGDNGNDHHQSLSHSTNSKIESLRGEERRLIFDRQRERLLTLGLESQQQQSTQLIQQQVSDSPVETKLYFKLKNIIWVLLKKLSQVSPSGRLLLESLSIWSERNDLAGSFYPLHSNAAPEETQSNDNDATLFSQRTSTNLLKYLLRLHLALFFFNSKYVSMLHRLTGIRYRRSTPLENSTIEGSKVNRPSYTFIASLIVLEGILGLSEITARLSIHGWEMLWSCCRRRRNVVDQQQRGSMKVILNNFVPSMTSSSQQRKHTSVSRSSACGICLNICESPAGAATHCGHVFCWKCILHWTMNIRPECPLCRKKCAPQDVMALYNW